jgi:STE24 endopeptidase
VILFGLIIALGLAILAKVYGWMRGRYGSGWRIGDISDPAGLPLVVALMSAYLFLMTPVVNRIIYTHVADADIFGVHASGEPEGFANVAMRLASYRKLEPGQLEEFWLFDHPSGYSRVKMAMTWRAENPVPDWSPNLPVTPRPEQD